ncbi:MAG: Fe-S cluster assembly protein SufB, partial [Candidatus Bipolaricaulia bacterium]
MVAIKNRGTKSPKEASIERGIEKITDEKDEPDWVTDLRYRGLRAFESAPQTDPIISEPLEFLADKDKTPAEGIESLDDLPPETKNLLDELGINEMEQRAIAGLTIQDGAGMIDSSFRENWEKKGVIMAPMNEALKRYPEARERFMKLYDPGA